MSLITVDYFRSTIGGQGLATGVIPGHNECCIGTAYVILLGADVSLHQGDGPSRVGEESRFKGE